MNHFGSQRKISFRVFDNLVLSINPRHKLVHAGWCYLSLQMYFLDPIYWVPIISSHSRTLRLCAGCSTRLRMYMALFRMASSATLGQKKKKSVTMHHQGKGYYFEILCSMLLKLPASELSVVLGKHKDFHAHLKDRYPAFLGLEC